MKTCHELDLNGWGLGQTGTGNGFHLNILYYSFWYSQMLRTEKKLPFLTNKEFVCFFKYWWKNSWKHVMSLTLMVGGWAKPEPEMAFISITSSASSPTSGFSMVTFVSMASGLLLILILMWIQSSNHGSYKWIIMLEKCGRPDSNEFQLKWRFGIHGNWKKSKKSKSKFWGRFGVTSKTALPIQTIWPNFWD